MRWKAALNAFDFAFDGRLPPAETKPNKIQLHRQFDSPSPPLIGTVYGMNFRRMPELDWTLGYPFALFLMAAVCAGLYLIFKRRGWL